eukprot:897176_1
MPKRRKNSRKRKHDRDDDGPPHKKQRGSPHLTNTYHSKHTNTDRNHNQKHDHHNHNHGHEDDAHNEMHNTNNTTHINKNRNDLMLFPFFRGKYSKLWGSYNTALNAKKKSSPHDDPSTPAPTTTTSISTHIEADFENPDDHKEEEEEEDTQPLDDDEDEDPHDPMDAHICSISVDTFDVNDLEHLIFFVRHRKIPIKMSYKTLSSLMYILDFFTQKIKSIELERYFEHYNNELIPFAMFNEWLQLNIYTANNKKELKSAIHKHCDKFRKISDADKKKLVTKIQKCLLRIVSFGDQRYSDSEIDLNDLCFNAHMKIKRHKHDRRDHNTLDYQEVRRLNEKALIIYWNGFKALNIHLHTDYEMFIDKYVLCPMDHVIETYFAMKYVDKEQLKCIPFSKLMYVLTDVYTLLFQQKGTFNKWHEAIKPLLDYIGKLASIFFEYKMDKKCRESDKYDVDEYEDKESCFTKLFKRFLIHSLKNKSYKFKKVMKRLLHKEPFIMYLYEEDEFMENVFFKYIHLSTVQQTELAKKLQNCNVYKHAQCQISKSSFRPKYKRFIEQALGISNKFDQSLLMNVPL